MKSNSEKTLHAVVDRFENDFVVVSFGKAGELILPRKKLPENLKEGDALSTEVITNEMAQKRKEQLAKEILKEILN